MMIHVPVCRAEFGLLVRYHVPWVHALRGPKRVEIEEGNEALYPSAAEWVVVPRGSDDDRRGMVGWRPPADAAALRFVPEPHVRQDISADVVICPRWRRYGAAKNWPHWVWLRDQLEGPTVDTFCAGAPDSIEPELSADIYERRFLDASIEAMKAAKLVVATDAGLAHLAVLCGAPLLLITYQGRTAPGPQVDAAGRVMEPAYGPVRLDEYYQQANHTGSPIHTIDAWEDPEAVARRVRELIDA